MAVFLYNNTVMNVQKFLLSSFKKSLSILGSEEIMIGGIKIQAVADEVGSSNALGIASVNNERNLSVTFPADSFTGKIRSGMIVEARGDSWQVSAESSSIRKGRAAITLILVEKERRSE